jgi:hypothetical protein
MSAAMAWVYTIVKMSVTCEPVEGYLVNRHLQGGGRHTVRMAGMKAGLQKAPRNSVLRLD